MIQNVRRVVCVAVGVVVAWSGSALARPGNDQAVGQRTVLAFEFAGCDAMLTDARDAALKQAMAMLPQRLAELSRELPDVPQPVAALAPRVAEILGKPMRFALVYDGDFPSGGGFGYGMVLSVAMPDERAAQQMHGEVSALMLAAGDRVRPKASTRFRGMTEISLQVALVSYGPRQSAGAWRYEIIAGTVNDPDAPFAGVGGETVMRVAFDAGPLAAIVEMLPAIGGQNPEGMQQLIDLINGSGLLGEDPLRVEAQWRTGPQGSVIRTSMRGQVVRGLGGDRGALTQADLAAIPADASRAWIGRMDFDWMRHARDQVAGMNPEIGALLGEFQARTGVDLVDDLFGALGGVATAYMSDSTGGGGLASMVGMVTFEDRAKFMASTEQLRAMANTLVDAVPIGPGYVRLASWRYDGIDLVSLRFNGLPIPVEVTYAITERWLIVGAMPQSVVAAARQVAGKGDSGLGGTPALASVLANGRQVSSVSFIDAQRAIRSGYPIVAMAGSAVSNGMRSPSDGARGPAMVVPPMNDLRSGARAIVGVTSWDGEALVMESHMDRSMLVNAAATIGAFEPFWPLLALPAAMMANERGW